MKINESKEKYVLKRVNYWHITYIKERNNTKLAILGSPLKLGIAQNLAE